MRLRPLLIRLVLICLAAPAAANSDGWRTEIIDLRSPQIETGSTGPAREVPRGPSLTGKTHALDGIASFYWQGQTTASGEPFDKRAMTAAHPTLPFNTMVEVINLGNGRKATVRINDRGPFKPGRVIDVSEAAAEVLGMQARGLAPVRLVVLGR